MGEYMMARLRQWPRKHECVGDVRGLGLMIGIEFSERSPELRDRIVQAAFERGVLVLGAGVNCIRLSPPLVITEEQADFAMDVLEAQLPR